MFAGLLNGLRKPCHGSWNWKFKLSNNPKIGNLESTLLFSILCHPFVLGLSSPLWLFSTLLVSFSSFILIYEDFECGNSWNNLNTGTKKEQYLARGSHVFSLCLFFFMNSWNKYETYSTRRKKNPLINYWECLTVGVREGGGIYSSQRGLLIFQICHFEKNTVLWSNLCVSLFRKWKKLKEKGIITKAYNDGTMQKFRHSRFQ